MPFQNEHELRAFLRTCIDPGPGRDKRTPIRLVEALPHQYAAALEQFAPRYLAAMGRTAAELTGRAEDMRHAYASSVLAWIRDEQPSDRLLDLSQEATAHARACSWCSMGGVLAATCDEGRRLAAALLAPSAAPEDRAQHCDGAALTHDETGICTHPVDQDEEPPCAHESWEVTSEYPEGQKWKTWVQSRRCADCRERLDDTRSAEPHFDEHRAGTAAAGHAPLAETTAAYLDEHDGEEWPALPTALPWAELLRCDEPFELLGELSLALQDGHAPREGETHDQRARRLLTDVDRILASWRNATEYRRPTSYLTRDGRVWTHQGEHHANEGPALYESPTSPKAYSVADLRDMYGWVAAIEGEAPADGVMTATFEDYARACRAQSLVPHTTVLVESTANAEVYAAVHVSLDPNTELSPTAVDEIRTAVCDGLAFRED
ncbi:hypothetical protein ABZ379_06330 [Streptomyces canus]|uniref:hypothetical protein n=1 Tax=Streptomyces canus TaxID=58343 RepID=UPI0033E5D5A2